VRVALRKQNVRRAIRWTLRFWHAARKKLGKLRRLSPRDIWQIEIMLAKRIPKPQQQQEEMRASSSPT
jgi:hypothetical protein